ncbi:ABC transporter ATP-binding protein [Solwaraspora sp. WMMD791]|uniref:ABC transporter ATP-binding protein n=1 Tax=Solwaraspora sp. WMMD791 TaxID=3016086 RepID=UPI00249C9E32|nr:ABC transporter ATP-binding protein [Solwaraspora sp. WMMD791]WFE25911.1 ABC transporter ATP-binding protein [Solwaraspora sp. WMMD791]
MPLLELRDVSKSYTSAAEEVRAVRGVSLAATAGEFICIHGPSGSGKSTLLNLIVGLDLADEGEIQVDGVDVGRMDEAARANLRLRTVGVVFQDHALVEEFTAAENVALPLEASGTATADALAQADRLLTRVGLADLGRRWPGQLSGGQRQRVGIARALAGGRRILVADEPTGSLDSRASSDLFELISELCSAGALAVVSSHDPLCRRYADAVYEMVDGSLRGAP